MSFFGYLAAGAAEGAGKGLADEGAYLDKANIQRELLAEKNAAELQRQRERLDDKSALALTLAGMKQDAAGTGKGGTFNLFQQMQAADTPEKQDRLAALIRATSGSQDAADAVGEVYGRGRSATINPSAGDFARFDRQADPETGANPAPVPSSYTGRADFDRQKGAIALQRLMAVAMDPAKLDPYSKGEAQTLRNDVTTGITLPDALKSGDRSVENMNEALSPLNPKAGLDEEKNSLAAERNRIRQQEADDKKTRGDQSLTARERKLLLDERKMAEKSAANPLTDPADAATAKERIKEIDRQIQSAPAASARSAAAPSAAKPRSPASAAAAFKAGRSY